MNILISGILGKMGHLIAHQTSESNMFTLLGGIDAKGRTTAQFIVYKTFTDAPVADVIIDFSYPEAIEPLCQYAIEKNIPLVLGTTGYTPAQQLLIRQTSEKIPVFQSANFSYGVLVMRRLLTLAAPYLKDFDIELVEAHHNQKADAPSGTAKLLIKTINEALPVERESVSGHGNGKRIPDTIGVHAIRAGSIPGDHSVLFASESESIEISHRAFSKDVFAQGALRAAQFIVSASVGYYTMDDLL